MKQSENTRRQRAYDRAYSGKNFSHTKKGPGRKHQQGKEVK